jgi:hypothetical protein
LYHPEGFCLTSDLQLAHAARQAVDLFFPDRGLDVSNDDSFVNNLSLQLPAVSNKNQSSPGC